METDQGCALRNWIDQVTEITQTPLQNTTRETEDRNRWLRLAKGVTMLTHGRND